MRKCSILLVVSLLLGGWCEVSGEERTGARPASDPRPPLTILFTGDILLDRGVRKVIERHGADALFSRDIDRLFSTAQVVVGNLECPATRIKAPVQKRYIFRAEPEWLHVLKRHGLTHLNLCNNHAIDQGRKGLMDTRQNVKTAGMVPIGAGNTMDEAARPVLLSQHPRRVWLVSSLRLSLENFAYLPQRPSVSQEPMEQLLTRVHQLRISDPASIIVVSLHWGGEHTLQPVPRQRLEAHRLIDAGADVLVCHHTHTLQTIEDYRGKKIYYSIGNFIFDQQNEPNNRACVVRLTVGKTSMKTETIPVVIRNCVPYLTNKAKEVRSSAANRAVPAAFPGGNRTRRDSPNRGRR